MRPVTERVANIAHFLTRNARRIGAEPAVIEGGEVTDWRTLDARVSALGLALREECGVGFGDRVLVHAVNSRACIEVQLACFRLGAVWCPCNFRLTPGEVAAQGRVAGPVAMVCGEGFAGHATAAREAGISRVIGTDYEALIAPRLGRDLANADVARDDPCWLFFTSGSTGRPKGVVLTQGQMTFTILNHLNDLLPGLGHRDRSLVVAPLSHGAGMHALVQLAAGAASVILPGPFEPAAAWAAVERYGITNLFAVPTIVKRLVENPRAGRSSLRAIIYAGAPMYKEDQRVALERLGPVLVQYYGLGEVTGAITVLRAEDHGPARSADAQHAAWYSGEREARGVRIDAGVARVGWRLGAALALGQALWAGPGGRRVLGHLLVDRVIVGGAARLEGFAFAGGRYVQHPDPETNFALFRAEGEGGEGDGAILTLRPHEEIGAVVAAAVGALGWEGAAVMGLGSLIGARFVAGEGMASPISEMLVLPGARDGRIGVATVDLEGEVFEGVLAEGGGEVCVTAELLLRKRARIGG